MLLWVGLGNPEPGMARQRHNVGFMALDRIAARHGFSPWRARFRGLVAEGQVGGERVVALKPLTYMNASGESVQAAAAFYKLAPERRVTAFHDELDLAPGKVRVKQGGGAAGHNGFAQHGPDAGLAGVLAGVRLGIGHPGDRERVLGVRAGRFFQAGSCLAAPITGRGGGCSTVIGGAKGRGLHEPGRHAGGLKTGVRGLQTQEAKLPGIAGQDISWVSIAV